MTDTPSPVDQAALAQVFLNLAAVTEQLLEACDGYRAQATERGYPSAVVDAMVVDFHHHMIGLLFAGTRPS